LPKTSSRLAWVAAGVAAAAASSTARAATVDTLRSYWNDTRTTIYSDIVVTHDDGTQESRRVLGGTVDGIGMVQIALLGSGELAIDYVPATNKSNAKLHWSGSCVFITPDSGGTKALAESDVIAALTAAASAWNDQAGTCSYLRYTVNPVEKLDVGYDGKNVLKFREDFWGHGGNKNDPFKMAATAITTLMFIDDASRLDNGTILDTDIEVNAINYAMAVGCETRCRTNATSGVVEDLQNTLTHELGHVLGLGHTCYSSDTDTASVPKDNTGQPAPNCNLGAALPPTVTMATMYPFQVPMETSKRNLSPDDINGACTTYPIDHDPKVCAPVEIAPKGCALVAGGGGAEGPVGAGVLGLLMALRARACSRSRRR
jgi:hypothetical protein